MHDSGRDCLAHRGHPSITIERTASAVRKEWPLNGVACPRATTGCRSLRHLVGSPRSRNGCARARVLIPRGLLLLRCAAVGAPGLLAVESAGWSSRDRIQQVYPGQMDAGRARRRVRSRIAPACSPRCVALPAGALSCGTHGSDVAQAVGAAERLRWRCACVCGYGGGAAVRHAVKERGHLGAEHVLPGAILAASVSDVPARGDAF